MSKEKKYYVYVHKYASGPKDGRVFYVGKGTGRRAWHKSRRNPHWLNIVNKYGFKSEIVLRFDREECAFSFEVVMISFYGMSSLCNMTSGGEGVRDYTWTVDHRRKYQRRLGIQISIPQRKGQP